MKFRVISINIRRPTLNNKYIVDLRVTGLYLPVDIRCEMNISDSL